MYIQQPGSVNFRATLQYIFNTVNYFNIHFH